MERLISWYRDKILGDGASVAVDQCLISYAFDIGGVRAINTMRVTDDSFEDVLVRMCVMGLSWGTQSHLKPIMFRPGIRYDRVIELRDLTDFMGHLGLAVPSARRRRNVVRSDGGGGYVGNLPKSQIVGSPGWRQFLSEKGSQVVTTLYGMELRLLSYAPEPAAPAEKPRDFQILSDSLPSSMFISIGGGGGWISTKKGTRHRRTSIWHDKEHTSAHRKLYSTFMREVLWLWWLRGEPNVPELVGVDPARRRLRMKFIPGATAYGSPLVGTVRRNDVAPDVAGECAVGFSWATYLSGDLTLGGLIRLPPNVPCPWHGARPCRRLIGGLTRCTTAPLRMPICPPRRIAVVLRGVASALDTPSLWKKGASPTEVTWRNVATDLKRSCGRADVFIHGWIGPDRKPEAHAMANHYGAVKTKFEPLATSFESEYGGIADEKDEDLSEMGFNPRALQRTHSMAASIRRGVELIPDLDAYDLIVVARCDLRPPEWLDLRRIDPSRATVLCKQVSSVVRASPAEGLHDWFVAGGPGVIRSYVSAMRRLGEVFTPATPKTSRSMHEFLRAALSGHRLQCLHGSYALKNNSGANLAVPTNCHAQCAGLAESRLPFRVRDGTCTMLLHTLQAVGIPTTGKNGEVYAWLLPNEPRWVLRLCGCVESKFVRDLLGEVPAGADHSVQEGGARGTIPNETNSLA